MSIVSELKTAFGSVFWSVLPVKDHLDGILSLLSSASGMSLSRSDLVRAENGRPEFPDCGFDANWTHSGNICVLAYSFRARVGVDIEIRRPRALRIADRFFSKEEKALLFRGGLSPEDARREFYRLWCRKEALFKCIGGSFLGDVLSQNVLEGSVKEAEIADIVLPSEYPCAAAIAVTGK